MKQLKVLFVAEYYPPYVMGGAELSGKLLVDELSKNAKVTVLTPNYGSYEDKITKEGKTTVIRFKSIRSYLYRHRESTSQKVEQRHKGLFSQMLGLYHKFSSWELTRAIERAAKKQSYDIIHANNKESVQALNDTKVQAYKIGHLRDMRFFNIERKTPKKQSYYPRINHFLAISEYLKKQYVRATNKNNITVIPNPISAMDVSVLTQIQARKKLSLPAKKRIVGFVGNLSKEKGAHVLPRLAKINPNVLFVAVGDGPLRETLEKTKPQNLLLAGRQPSTKVKHYYKAFDTLLLPTLVPEGFGRVVIEGQVNECAVIAYGSGGIPELLLPPDKLVKSNDEKALARALKTGAFTSGKIKTRTSSIYKTYHAKTIVSQVLKAYQNVLKK